MSGERGGNTMVVVIALSREVVVVAGCDGCVQVGRVQFPQSH